jgi:putative sigma-54 modulation protein
MSNKSKAMEFANDVYDISITGRNVLVTDAMKNYAIDKISKIDRFHGRVIDVSVTMDIQRVNHIIDIILKFDSIKIKSSAETTDMYASIDKAVDRLEKQIMRYKSRIQDHHARATKVIDMNVNVLKRPRHEIDEINDDIDSESGKRVDKQFARHDVITRTTRPLKVLRLDEAIMRMELSGDQFLIYRSEEDTKIKVIYRRKDENYGIIEIEN